MKPKKRAENDVVNSRNRLGRHTTPSFASKACYDPKQHFQ